MNLMITFIVSGLWHGANWTFIIWGAVHGSAQVIENFFIKPKKSQGLKWFAKVLLIFTFCVFAWVLFRAKNMNEALYVFQCMFDGILSPLGYFMNGFRAIGVSKLVLAKISLCLLLLVLHDYFAMKNDLFARLEQHSAVIRYAYVYLIVLMILLFGHAGQSTFVYFQF